MENPITVAALIALPSDSWVNGGFVATVRSVERKMSKANKPFWKCYLGDALGNAQVSATFFAPPKFIQGNRVSFTGSGIKFTNDTYGPSVKVGDKATIEVLGGDVHVGPAPQQEYAAPVPPPRAMVPQPTHTQGAPAQPIGPIHGASVGGGIARSVEVLLATKPQIFATGGWQNEVYALAVGFCDIQQAIENGRPLPSSEDVPY